MLRRALELVVFLFALVAVPAISLASTGGSWPV
jgi:hypothetical protein